MTEFDLTEDSPAGRQPEVFRTFARTFDGLADIAEGGLPQFDRNAHEDHLQDVTQTDTRFSDTWSAIKGCFETHFETTALDESLDRDAFESVSISGHPPSDRAMMLSVQYHPQGILKIDINNP